MDIWRPFDEPEDSYSFEQNEPENTKGKKMFVKVGENEKKLVLDAYSQSGHGGWNAVYSTLKDNTDRLPLNSRTVDYYLETGESTCIRRMQRIVREETKQAAITQPGRLDHQGESSPELARAVVTSQMRYAKKQKPEERKAEKLSYFVDSSSSDDEEAEAIKEPRPKQKKMTAREAATAAQTALTEMCKKAMKNMGFMSRVLEKLDKKLDEM